MKKVIKEIENLFSKYDCYSLHDLEEQSDSFGSVAISVSELY